MLQKLRNRIDEEKGFTLIELLVVILIIGILAAIALPVFLGQQEKGQDASAKSNVRNAYSQVEACFADAPNQNYSTDCGDDTALGGKTKTGFTFIATGTPATGEILLNNLTDKTFTVTANSASGTTFSIGKAADGTVSRTCSGTSAGCKNSKW